MKKLNFAGTVIRRLIIVIFAILLIPQVIQLIPSGNSDKKYMESLQQDDQVLEYKINKKMDLDGDTFTVKKLYISPDQVIIYFSVRKQDPMGWSFAGSGMKLIHSNGEEFTQQGSSSSGNPWGATGFLTYTRETNEPYDRLTLQYDWYDRHAELNIPLVKDGEGQ